MSDTAYVLLHIKRASGEAPVVKDAGIYSEFPLTMHQLGDWTALLTSYTGRDFHHAVEVAMADLTMKARHDALHRWVLRCIARKPRVPSHVTARAVPRDRRR